MPTAAFTTLGCKVNQYETQRILESFEAAGFEILPFDSLADVYVINTCSVTSIAESKSRYAVRRANRSNPLAKVVVTGCAGQMAINKRESLDGAHVLVPNPDKLDTLRHFLNAYPELRPAQPAAEGETRTHSGRSRATLKVQDGCDVYCSYCSIPFTRPGMKSQPYSELLEEAKTLVALGYREIILTGVLIGAYGPNTGSEGPRFEEMVRGLAQESGVERLRISSIEMRQVTPGLISLIQDGLVVPHLHIPLQSGDDRVLQDMNRPYSRDGYISLCQRLYREVPDISLTTDVMVGFPTETDERFRQTAELCREAAFLKIHSFRFSPRYGTKADEWGDPVSNEEKVSRSAELAKISAETAKAHVAKFLGRTMRVVAEGKTTRDGLLEGLTDNYLTVQFPGPRALQRRSANVRLLEISGDCVLGELASGRELAVS